MIGHVSKLWRYPVKSMLGEECQGIELDHRGVRGDRLFAVRNGDGKLGSGKSTRRFCQIDGLFGFRAAMSMAGRALRFPTAEQCRVTIRKFIRRCRAYWGFPLPWPAKVKFHISTRAQFTWSVPRHWRG